MSSARSIVILGAAGDLTGGGAPLDEYAAGSTGPATWPPLR